MSDPPAVRMASRRDQHVTAQHGLLGGSCARRHALMLPPLLRHGGLGTIVDVGQAQGGGPKGGGSCQGDLGEGLGRWSSCLSRWPQPGVTQHVGQGRAFPSSLCSTSNGILMTLQSQLVCLNQQRIGNSCLHALPSAIRLCSIQGDRCDTQGQQQLTVLKP